MSDLVRLEQALNYGFSNPRLLEEALTHRSAGGRHNERLEFLGDAVLGFIVAERLYQTRPDDREGSLSRLRARLVRRETLAELARELALGEHLRMGAGELRSGGFQRDSILADAMEAIIGAVYLDAGVEAARELIARLLDSRMAALPRGDDLRDAKTRLQEFLQARQLPLPEYLLVEESGVAHKPWFTVECSVAAEQVRTKARGRSRRAAEQEAAKLALAQLTDGAH